MADEKLTRYGELRDALLEFAAAHSDMPEGDEADRYRREIGRRYEQLADDALNEAAAAAQSLAKDGKYAEAAQRIRLVGTRFTEGSWFTMRGERAIGEAIVEIEGMKTRAIASALAEARAALDAGALDEVRTRLPKRDAWPEESRAQAQRLIEEAEARAAEIERVGLLSAATKVFLLDVVRAGGKGIAAVEAVVERDRAKLAGLGSVEDVERVEYLIRSGTLTESLAVEGFLASGRRVRVYWDSQPVSGEVIRADRSTITLKTSVGREVDIPLVEIRLEDILAASQLTGDETSKKLRAAEYLFLRGALAEAQAASAGLEGDAAAALRAEIERATVLLETAAVDGPEGETNAVVQVDTDMAEANPAPNGPGPGSRPSGTTTEYADVLSGLIGYWPFDEGQGDVSADRTRGGKHAQLRNGTSWAAGVLGDAIRLDGSNDYVEIEKSQSHALNAGSFTVSVWTDSAKEGYLLCRGPVSGTGWQVWARRWFFRGKEGAYVETFTDKNTEGVWAQLAVTYDAETKKMTGYLDGTPVGTIDVAVAMADIDAGKDWPLVIGTCGGQQEKFFPGRIDELRIYDRCLSAEEMKSVYGAVRREAAHRMLEVVPKSIGKIGGAIAADSAFDESLQTALSEEAGYTFAKRLALASNSALPPTVSKLLVARLSREKPQVVRVCFDAKQLARIADEQEFEDDLVDIVQRSQQLGVTPVLYTIPVRTPDKLQAERLTAGLNMRIERAAHRAGLHAIDAYTILNANPDAYFSSATKLTAEGYKAINDEFLKIYRLLEKSGFARTTPANGK